MKSILNCPTFLLKKEQAKKTKKLGIIPNYKFIPCERTCKEETDIYSNGTIQLNAEFKNGLVIGELKRYYQSGKIKEISIYDKDGFLTKTILFEENGNIKKK